MKQGFFLLLSMVSVLGINISFGQVTVELPAVVDFTVAGNCSKYEKDVINAANWLEETEIDKEKQKRADVLKFITNWTGDCGKAGVVLNDALADIYGRNYQLLGIYIASFIRYSIESKDEFSTYDAVETGLRSMMTAYKKNKSIKRSKGMVNMISIFEKKLQEYYIFQKFDVRKEVVQE